MQNHSYSQYPAAFIADARPEASAIGGEPEGSGGHRERKSSKGAKHGRRLTALQAQVESLEIMLGAGIM